MSKTIVGIDTIPISLIHPDSKYASLAEFEKSGSEKIEDLKGFFTVIGLAIVVNDYEKFKEAYSKAIKSAFEENGYGEIDTSVRRVLCSKDLREYSEGEDALHESFFKHIKNHLQEVNVIFSSFDVQRIPDVKILGSTRHNRTVHPKILTIKYLTTGFPHICVWKLLSYLRSLRPKIFIDHFDGKRTQAWEKIEEAALDISIHFKGDECNPAIATADILLRCLESRIEKKKTTYDYNGISKVLPEIETKLHIHNINAKHYPYITPRDERNLPLRKYIQRPVFFLISPSSKEIDVPFFLSQPNGRKFISNVCEKGGCYKTFSKGQDKAILKDGDFLVFFDDEGQKTAETIKRSSGHSITILNFTDLG